MLQGPFTKRDFTITASLGTCNPDSRRRELTTGHDCHSMNIAWSALLRREDLKFPGSGVQRSCRTFPSEPSSTTYALPGHPQL